MLLKILVLMCVFIGVVLWNIVYVVIMIYFLNYVVFFGLFRKEVLFLFIVIGIGIVFLRIVIGLVIGFNGFDLLLLNFGLSVCMGVLIVIFLLFVNFLLGFMVFVFLYGIYSGGLFVFIVFLCLEIVGV